jgi:hypothetical protein
MAERGRRDLKFLLFAGFLLVVGVVALAYCASPMGGPPPTSGPLPLSGGSH